LKKIFVLLQKKELDIEKILHTYVLSLKQNKAMRCGVVCGGVCCGNLVVYAVERNLGACGVRWWGCFKYGAAGLLRGAGCVGAGVAGAGAAEPGIPADGQSHSKKAYASPIGAALLDSHTAANAT